MDQMTIRFFKRRLTLSCVLMAFATFPALHSRALSQEPASDSSLDRSMVKELDELRAKVRRLEATLGRNAGSEARPGDEGSGKKGGGMAGKGMAKGKEMDGGKMAGKGMGMEKAGKEKGGMGMKGMGMEMGGKKMAGKGMMGSGPKMGGMSMQSALPGFPGASHLYHIGETGFFLDHPQHITLTTDQQKKLNDIKTGTMLADGTFERQIDEAEQQLWTLTAAGEPDIKKIEAKIREIGKLNGDRRLAYIRGIGEAGEVLTDDQRQTLLGEHAPKGGQP